MSFGDDYLNHVLYFPAHRLNPAHNFTSRKMIFELFFGFFFSLKLHEFLARNAAFLKLEMM